MSSRSTAHYRRKSRQLNRLLQHSNTSNINLQTVEQWNQYYIEQYSPEFPEEERCHQLRRQAAQEGNRAAITIHNQQQGLILLATAT